LNCDKFDNASGLFAILFDPPRQIFEGGWIKWFIGNRRDVGAGLAPVRRATARVRPYVCGDHGKSQRAF